MTHTVGNGPDFGQIRQNQSWPIALASRGGTTEKCSCQPHIRRNTRTIKTFQWNVPGGEVGPSMYIDSVPQFPAAQDEGGEAFKANQAYRQSRLVVFASCTLAKHAAIPSCGRQALPLNPSPFPSHPLLTKPVWPYTAPPPPILLP